MATSRRRPRVPRARLAQRELRLVALDATSGAAPGRVPGRSSHIAKIRAASRDRPRDAGSPPHAGPRPGALPRPRVARSAVGTQAKGGMA